VKITCGKKGNRACLGDHIDVVKDQLRGGFFRISQRVAGHNNRLGVPVQI
jgi:hypothetical protein